jgi:hypothetical protein
MKFLKIIVSLKAKCVCYEEIDDILPGFAAPAAFL